MKYIFAFIVFLIFTFSVLSQNVTSSDNVFKNDIHFNALQLIGFKNLEISYGRALGSSNQIGISIMKKIGSTEYDDDLWERYYRRYSISPYYRHYFSKKHVEGFFIEGFALYQEGEIKRYDEPDVSYNALGLGIGAGVKIISLKRMILSIYGGLGRNFTGQEANDFVERLGVDVGFRF